MMSNAMMTVMKMTESLPEPLQQRVAEHLREFLADLQDEMLWDTQFSRSQSHLKEIAWQAKRETEEGKAEPFDLQKL